MPFYLEVIEMAEMLVVRSKVKEYAKKKKMSFGADAAGALSAEVAALIDKAIARAKANKRATVKGRDV